MPDQYTFKAFDDLELAPGDRGPVMAEIDLVSSHTPWSPSPASCPWDRSATARSIDGMQATHTSSTLPLLGDGTTSSTTTPSRSATRCPSLVSFVRHAHDKNLVMVVLGDHQPNSLVSGTGVSHDVPMSLIAHDPHVLHRITDWGWTPGLRPRERPRRMRMDAFRDQFLSAFGSTPSGPVDTGLGTTATP